MVADGTLEAAQRREAVWHGLIVMYRFLVRDWGSLVDSAVWRGLWGQRVRYLPRPTATYGALVMASLQPHRLEGGVDREIELDVVSGGAVGRERRDGLWPVIRGEGHAVSLTRLPGVFALSAIVGRIVPVSRLTRW